jgi:hypothetical protein
LDLAKARWAFYGTVAVANTSCRVASELVSIPFVTAGGLGFATLPRSPLRGAAAQDGLVLMYDARRAAAADDDGAFAGLHLWAGAAYDFLWGLGLLSVDGWASWFHLFATRAGRAAMTHRIRTTVRLSEPRDIEVAIVPVPHGASCGNIPQTTLRQKVLRRCGGGTFDASLQGVADAVADTLLQAVRGPAAHPRDAYCSFDIAALDAVYAEPERDLCLAMGQSTWRSMKDASVTTRVEWDLAVPALLLLALFADFVRVASRRNRGLQLAFCFFFGMLILAAIFLYFSYRTASGTRVGRAGAFAAVGIIGVVAFAQGFVAYAMSGLFAAVHASPAVAAAVSASSIVATGLTRYFLGGVMPTLITASMLSVQAFSVVLAFARNREFALGCVLLFTLARIAMVWALPEVVGSMIPSLWPDADAPRDVFPDSARSYVRYRRPMCAAAVVGADANARARAYRTHGLQHTRRALDELAAEVRRNPQKYMTRVREPGELFRFAGVSTGDDASVRSSAFTSL